MLIRNEWVYSFLFEVHSFYYFTNSNTLLFDGHPFNLFFFFLNSCPSIWLYAFTTLTTLNQRGMILVYDVWNIHIEWSTICEIFTLNESHNNNHSAVKALLSSMPIAFSYTCPIIALVHVCNLELFIASLILWLYFISL